MSTMRQRPVTMTSRPVRGTVAVGDRPSRFEVRCGEFHRTVDVQPDFDMASKWSRALKHIHHVELRNAASTEAGAGGWAAWLHGTGHRTPTRCRISVPTAVALGLRRVPVVVAVDGEAAR
jgi:hypothetical protein